MIKPCRKCGADSDHYDSIPTCCKECWKARVMANRSARIEQYRKYDRIRNKTPERRERDAIRGKLPHRKALKKRIANYPENKAKKLIITRKYRASNPEKAYAHGAVNGAKNRGTLKPKPRCERCGNKTPLSGHHEDYSKPLEVIWLCSTCHAQRHIELAKMKKSTR